jgi:hypothetical protein
MQIKLFTKNNIDQLIWPHTKEAQQVRNFFLPLLNEGVDAFIENVKTRLFLLQVDDLVIPITVNEKEYNNAYVTSNYVFISILKQKLRASRSLRLLTPFVMGLDLALRMIKINKVVIVNNWLMTLSLHKILSDENVQMITNFLIKQFPDHSIMWRSLNNYRSNQLLDALENFKYHLINARKIYFFDPSKEKEFGQRARRHLKQDLEVFKESGYEVLRNKDIKEKDFPRLIELYEMIYVEKYKNVSPIFNEKFLSNLLTVENIEFIALKKETIDGFCVLLKTQQEMSMAFIGHDTKLPLSSGVYRMLNCQAIQEAKNSCLLFNQSSGADTFKEWRGGIKTPEYVAIYDQHLPLSRRFILSVSSKAVKLLGKLNRV